MRRARRGRRTVTAGKGAVVLASLLAAMLGAAVDVPVSAAAETAPRETFAIDYGVTVRGDELGVAHVRWELSGGEEVESFRFKTSSERFSAFSGSGRVEVAPTGEVTWYPGGPYGHLEYKVRIDHRRGDKGHFDSYAGNDWILLRARDLFPPVRFAYTPRKDGARPRSRARLLFHLPPGWKSATAHPSAAADAYALVGNRILNRPSGWIALGNLQLSHQEIDDVMVRMARVPGSNLQPEDVYAMLGDAMPRLRRMFRQMPPEILVVSAGDPMWRGGLSADHSLFLHGDRPLRTPDKTSPLLHEMFHVTAPFRGRPDADWVIEGLAEYYSLELQRRSGALTAKGFAKGLSYFARYGLWNVDLTTQKDNAATNNSAPLVMYALDQRIQRDTAGKKNLDDVVSVLAESGGWVDTAAFLAAVQKVSGKKFDRFFAQHVERGEMPRVDSGNPPLPTNTPSGG